MGTGITHRTLFIGAAFLLALLVLPQVLGAFSVQKPLAEELRPYKHKLSGGLLEQVEKSGKGEGRVFRAGGGEEIFDVIVLTDKKFKAEKAQVAALGQEAHQFQLIDAVAMRVPAKGLVNVAKRPGVKMVFEDAVGYIIEDKPGGLELTTSVNSSFADRAWALGYKGQGITVAVLDTGVRYSHQDLGGCSLANVSSGNCAKIAAGYDFHNDDSDPNDDHGHGTHCAGSVGANGTLKGVAPEARIMPIKVCSSGGSCVESNLMKGLEFAYIHGARVNSISLGWDERPRDGLDPKAMLVDELSSRGVVTVVAAGNAYGIGITGSPGVARTAITVGAQDDGQTMSVSDDTIASFSSRGPSDFGRLDPDIAAPGVSIYSTYKDSDSSYYTQSGTSMACPHVAGASAVVLGYNSSFTSAQVRSRLMGTTYDITGYNVFAQGAGGMNVSHALSTQLVAYANGNGDRWEATGLPGQLLDFNVTLHNLGNNSVNVSFWALALWNGAASISVTNSSFTFPYAEVGAGSSATKTVYFSVPSTALSGTYGTRLVMDANNSEQAILPLVVSVAANATRWNVSDSVDNDEYLNAPLSQELGDRYLYPFYVPANASKFTATLRWPVTTDDLDLYVYDVYGVDAGNSTSEPGVAPETVTLANPKQGVYWAEVYSYYLPNGAKTFNLTVSFESNVSVVPDGVSATMYGENIREFTFNVSSPAEARSGLLLAAKKTQVRTKAASGTLPPAGGCDNVTFGLYSLAHGNGILSRNTTHVSAWLNWQNASNSLYLTLTQWRDSDEDKQLDSGEYGNHQYYSSDYYAYLNETAAYDDNETLGNAYIGNQWIDSNIDDFILRVCTNKRADATGGYNLTINVTDLTAWTWASASPANLSSIPAGGNEVVTLRLNASGVANGSFSGHLYVQDASVTYVQVPLNVTVREAREPPAINRVGTGAGANLSGTTVSVNFTVNLSDTNGVDTVNLDFTSLPAASAVQDQNGISRTAGSATAGVWSRVVALDKTGGYRYKFWVNNTKGAETVGTEQSLAVVDGVPPTLNVQAPANNTNATNLTLRYTAQDATPGLDKCWFDLDGTLNRSAIYTCGNYSKALSDGAHYLIVYANDTLNNINASANITFRVDATPPRVAIQTPAVGQAYSDTTPDLNFTVQDSSRAIDQCWYSNSSWAVNTSIANCTNATLDTLADGWTNLWFAANDTLGNLNATVNVSFRIDTTAPVLNIQSPTNNTNATSLTLQYTVQDATAGLDKCWFDLDGTLNYTAISTCGNYSAALSEGTHHILVYANDTAGNQNTSANLTFHVDATPPAVRIQSPAVGGKYASATPSLNFTVQDASSSVDRCWYSNSSWAANVSITNCQNVTLNNLAEGWINLWVAANDTEGNLNTTVNVSFRVDLTAPAISGVRAEPAIGVINQNVTFYATVSDADGVNSTWGRVSRLGTQTNVTFSSGAGVFAGTNETGAYNLTVWANDTAGNLANYSTSFTVKEPVRLVLNLTNSTGAAPGLLVEFTYNSNIVSNITANATADTVVGNSSYQVVFRHQNATFTVIVTEVNVTANTTIQARYEPLTTANLPNPSVGALTGNAMAFDPNLTALSQVCIRYANLSYQSAGNLKLFKCAWNFTSRACTGSLTQLDSSVDGTALKVCSNVSSFSAFSVGERPYSGDGTCEDSESCSISDCTSASRCRGGGGSGGSSTLVYVPVVENKTAAANKSAEKEGGLFPPAVETEKPPETVVKNRTIETEAPASAQAVEERINAFSAENLPPAAAEKLEAARKAFADKDYDFAMRLLDEVEAMKSAAKQETKAAMPTGKTTPAQRLIWAVTFFVMIVAFAAEHEGIGKWLKVTGFIGPAVPGLSEKALAKRLDRETIDAELRPLWDIEGGKLLLYYIQETDTLLETGRKIEAMDAYRDALHQLHEVKERLPAELRQKADEAVKNRRAKVLSR